MISGATRGRGGASLGRHVANASKNEAVEIGPSRGLVASDIKGQVAELTALGSHARTRRPIYHMHINPAPEHPWNEAQRKRFWELFETEFGLERQPFASQIHVKNGRSHEHREYLRTRADGSAIRMDHDFSRREKLARIVEFEFNLAFTTGKFNRAVIAALIREGRPDVAKAMQTAGLDRTARPVAALSPSDRMRQERTGIAKADIQAAAWSAWTSSDSGLSLSAALAERGLRLAAGDKAAVVLDSTGNIHPLVRLIGAASKAETGERVPAKDVTGRLAGLRLDSVADVRIAIRDRAPMPAATDVVAQAGTGHAVSHQTATETAMAPAKPESLPPAKAPPPDKAQALRRIVQAEHRLANDRGPWPNPGDRDAFGLARRFADAVRQKQTGRLQKCRNAQLALRRLDRLAAAVGVATDAVKQADLLYDAWHAGERTLDSDIDAAQRRGVDLAHCRQDERQFWQRRHDREIDRMRRIRHAVEAGDGRITRAVIDGRMDVADDPARAEDLSLAGQRRAIVIADQPRRATMSGNQFGACRHDARRDPTRKAAPSPDYWTALGFAVDILLSNCLLVKISTTADIEDQGDKMFLHRIGEPSDEEIAILVAACRNRMGRKDGWTGVRFFGSPAFQLRCRAEAIRQGIAPQLIEIDAPAPKAVPMPDHVRRRLNPTPDTPENPVPELPPPAPTPEFRP